MKKIINNVLYFDSCNTVDLAHKYGTPLYVYSENDILKRCTEIKETFLNKYDNTRAAYASKAFSCLAMYKIIDREGLCLDIVSGGELHTAIKVGFPPEKIEFNGNNKLYSEIEAAVDYNIGRFIVDNVYELNLIENICKNKGKKVNILYRITPGVKSDSHDYIVTGKKDSKFGIPIEDEFIYDYIEKAIKSDYVNFLGFHFHLGSQLNSNKSYMEAIETILKLVKESKLKFGYETSEINIGGGFGINYTDDSRKPLSYFMDPIMIRISEFSSELGIKRPCVAIEPGRSIVGEAGITLYSVGSIKNIKGIRKYVAVDGGMFDNIRPALYQAQYSAVIANKADEICDDLVTICGKCCESGDILIKDMKLPKAEPGDIIAVFSTGAYGYAMANNYNKNPIPPSVLVKDGRDELIIKRQSYDDIIRNEIIPESLL